MKLILLLALHGGAHASTRHKATKNAVDEATTQRLAAEAASASVIARWAPLTRAVRRPVRKICPENLTTNSGGVQGQRETTETNGLSTFGARVASWRAIFENV